MCCCWYSGMKSSRSSHSCRCSSSFALWRQMACCYCCWSCWFWCVIMKMPVILLPLSLVLSWLHWSCCLSPCLWCCHGYTTCTVGPAAFGVFVATLLVILVLLFLVSSWLDTLLLMLVLLSWLHCSWCWSCSLWCCQGNTARGHDARTAGFSGIRFRHGPMFVALLILTSCRLFRNYRSEMKKFISLFLKCIVLLLLKCIVCVCIHVVCVEF